MHSKLNKKGDLINAEYFCSGAFILSYEHIHLDILHIYLVFIFITLNIYWQDQHLFLGLC